MSKRPALTVLLATILGVFALVALTLWQHDQDAAQILTSDFNSGYPELSTAEFEEIEGMALAACQCVRAGDDHEGCWADYRSQVQHYPQQADATACAPVSVSTDCFPTVDGERCIVTSYDVNGAATEDRDVVVCTDAEARAIERAASAPFEPNGRPIDSGDEQAWAEANAQSNRNLAEVMERIRRGEPFPDEENLNDGCV